jgi:hypothetical protein
MLMRAELFAAVTMMAVLMAGALAKLGHARWGIGVVAGFAWSVSLIEHLPT